MTVFILLLLTICLVLNTVHAQERGQEPGAFRSYSKTDSIFSPRKIRHNDKTSHPQSEYLDPDQTVEMRKRKAKHTAAEDKIHGWSGFDKYDEREKKRKRRKVCSYHIFSTDDSNFICISSLIQQRLRGGKKKVDE